MILITGASSGIGEATAQAFAAQKKDLFLVARRGGKLRELADIFKKKYSVHVETAELDVSNSKAVKEWANRNASLLGKTEVLVNNAGLARGLASFQEGNIEDWDAMIDTNIKGFLYVARAVIPHFIEKKSGHIINIGSVAGRWTYPKGNVYSATKFAVRGLSESMRLDLNGTGIRVTEIAPGMVETEFSVVRFGGDKEKAKSVYKGLEPLTAQDIAETIVWSAQRPKHVNIQELVIYPTDQASPQVVHRK
ncbi:SDR family NAD(P)-dependent oxidoreductase [bacterium]|nr:SDR family NAD(P)-dependent oxidoreductase [bacterium]